MLPPILDRILGNVIIIKYHHHPSFIIIIQHYYRFFIIITQALLLLFNIIIGFLYKSYFLQKSYKNRLLTPIKVGLEYTKDCFLRDIVIARNVYGNRLKTVLDIS